MGGVSFSCSRRVYVSGGFGMYSGVASSLNFQCVQGACLSLTRSLMFDPNEGCCARKVVRGCLGVS